MWKYYMSFATCAFVYALIQLEDFGNYTHFVITVTNVHVITVRGKILEG